METSSPTAPPLVCFTLSLPCTANLLSLPKMADWKLVQMHWMIYLVWLLHKADTHTHMQAHLQLLPHTHTHTYCCSHTHTYYSSLSHTHWERFGSLDIKQQQPFAVCLLLPTEGAFSVFVHFNWPLWMMWPSVLIALSLHCEAALPQLSPAALISALCTSLALLRLSFCSCFSSLWRASTQEAGIY